MSPDTCPTKEMPCRVCGRPQVVSKYRSKPVRCLDCAEEALADALRQMASKSGPIYEAMCATRRRQGRIGGRGSKSSKETLIFPDQDA